MCVKNVPSIRNQPLLEAHDADPLFQIWWEDDEQFGARKLESMKGVTNCARIL